MEKKVISYNSCEHLAEKDKEKRQRWICFHNSLQKYLRAERLPVGRAWMRHPVESRDVAV